MALLHIFDILGSNLSLKTDPPDQELAWYTSVPPVTYQDGATHLVSFQILPIHYSLIIVLFYSP
jgi:hypothetical protein